LLGVVLATREKVEVSKEKWGDAEVYRISEKIALKSLTPDPEEAEAYFGYVVCD
jgi:hypothetical protein